jgi:hypothetical protein
MIIKKAVISLTLNLILVIFLTSLLIIGCGKKESTEQSAGDKQEQSSNTKSENITENTPVHYILQATGDMVGKWDIYAKGNKAKVNLDLTVAGQTTHSEMYRDGSMMYMITDVGGKKTGIKMDITKFNEENSKKGEFNPTNFKEGCKDCEKIGNEDLLGRPCTIYQDKKGTKYSVYDDKYPLKIEMPKTTILAKSLDINVNITDDMFIPPKDINYVEMDKMLEGLKNPKDMNNKLKDMEEKLKELKK